MQEFDQVQPGALQKWTDIIARRIKVTPDPSLRQRLEFELPLAALTEIRWKHDEQLKTPAHTVIPLSDMAKDFYLEYKHPFTGQIPLTYWHDMEARWQSFVEYLVKEAGSYLHRVLSASATHVPPLDELKADTVTRTLEKLLPTITSGEPGYFQWKSTLRTYGTKILHMETLQILRAYNALSSPWFDINQDKIDIELFLARLLNDQDDLMRRLRETSFRSFIDLYAAGTAGGLTHAMETELFECLNKVLRDPHLVPTDHYLSQPNANETDRALNNRSYLIAVFGQNVIQPPRKRASMRHPGEGARIVSLEEYATNEDTAGTAISNLIEDPASRTPYRAIEALQDMLTLAGVDYLGKDGPIIRYAVGYARQHGNFPPATLATNVAANCGCEIEHTRKVLNALQRAIRYLRIHT